MNVDVDPGYMPSCVVNLTLRFDEALQVAQDQAGLDRAARTGALGLRPEQLTDERSVTVKYGDITAESYDQSGTAITRRVAGGRRTSDSTGPVVRVGQASVQRYDADGEIVTTSVVSDEDVPETAGPRRGLMPITFGGDSFTVIMNAVPDKGSFDLPHPRQAPKFQLTFKYDTLPIDPRLLRAAGVEIHLGCVSAQDFGDGMNGGHAKDGRSSSILSTRVELLDPATGRPAIADSTLLFYGTVDEWEVNHGDDGSTATLVGRGIVGILLDGKPPADVMTKIDLTRPIHRVVADLIATIPTDARLALDVMTDASEWPNGVVPSPGSIEGFTNIRLGAADGQPKAGGGGGDKVSYWDLITNLCNFVGAVPYLQGSTLWIRPGHSIFELLDNPGRAPFRSPRSGPDGPIAVRRMILGRNVERFRLKRAFGGTPVPVVKVYGLDDQATGKDRVVTGQWPPKDSAAAKSKTDDEVLHVPIGGVRDPDRLVAIARDIYEEVGRGEIGGEFSTKSLASFGGGNSDPDLLRLRPLDPVQILVDSGTGPTPIVHELTARLSMTFDAEVTALASRLGDRDAATAIVAARRGVIIGVLDAYRVTSVRYEVDAATGVQVTAEFQNYIVARHGTETSPHASAHTTTSPRVKSARVDNPGQNRRGTITKRKAAEIAVNAMGYGFLLAKGPRGAARLREEARLARIQTKAIQEMESPTFEIKTGHGQFSEQ